MLVITVAGRETRDRERRDDVRRSIHDARRTVPVSDKIRVPSHIKPDGSYVMMKDATR